MRLHARNPRRTTLAEPAQNADAHNAHNARKPRGNCAKRRRAEPARTIKRVLLILLVAVVVVVAVAVAVVVVVVVVVVLAAAAVAVAVAVAAAVAVAVGVGVVVVVIIMIISYSSPISACQTKPTHAKRLVALLDGGEQSNSESNKATSTRKPLFSKLFAL